MKKYNQFKEISKLEIKETFGGTFVMPGGCFPPFPNPFPDPFPDPFPGPFPNPFPVPLPY